MHCLFFFRPVTAQDTKVGGGDPGGVPGGGGGGGGGGANVGPGVCVLVVVVEVVVVDVGTGAGPSVCGCGSVGSSVGVRVFTGGVSVVGAAVGASAV